MAHAESFCQPERDEHDPDGCSCFVHNRACEAEWRYRTGQPPLERDASRLPVIHLSLDPRELDEHGAEFDRLQGMPHDAASRLLGTVEILGTLHHLEFIEVEDAEDGQRAVIAELESSLDAAYEICGAAPLATVTYNNRSYVVLLTPEET